MNDESTTASDRHLDPVPDGPGDGAPGTTAEWKRVSPKYVVVDVVSTAITSVVLVVATGLPWWFIREPVWLVLPAVFLVIGVLLVAFTPRRVRSIAYRLRDDDLLFRRGILFQRFVAVPYGRMQLVDVTRGPLERAIGLSQLKLVTAAAASNVSIPGLTEADADALRDHLVELAETRRAGL